MPDVDALHNLLPNRIASLKSTRSYRTVDVCDLALRLNMHMFPCDHAHIEETHQSVRELMI
jgi:hypothetical protein